MDPRVYVYRITFEEVSNYYIGWHLEKKFGEYYMGSPKTNKHYWDLYSPIKEFLKFFDNSDKGVMEALEYEKKLIRETWGDGLCLNRNAGGVIHPQVSKDYWADPCNRKRHSEVIKSWRQNNPWFVEKMSLMRGENHPGFGSIWITDGTLGGNVRVPRNSEIPEGYMRGLTKDVNRENHPHWGARWATNGTFEGNILIPPGGEIPEGYYWGRYLEQEGSDHPMYGKMWITDGTVNGNKVVDKGEEIPEGYRAGRVYPRVGENHHNFGTMWITNGSPGENKMVPKGSVLPSGYYPGYTPSCSKKPHPTLGSIWITDESTGKNKRIPPNSDIPDGFRKGKSHKRKPKTGTDL